MQNLLGNILSFMDVYEKSSVAAEKNDYLTVVFQFGRAIRRAIIFDSMTSAGVDDDVVLQPKQKRLTSEPEHVPIDSDLKRAYVDNKEMVHAAIETAHHAIVQAAGPIVTHTISSLVNDQVQFRVPKHEKPISPNSYGIISSDLSQGLADRLTWSHTNIYIFRSMQGLLGGTFASNNMTTCGSRLVQLNENIQDMIVYVDFDTFNYHLSCLIATIGYSLFHCYYAGQEVIQGAINMSLGIGQVMALRQITFLEYAAFNGVWTGPSNFDKWRQIKKLITESITWRNMTPDLVQQKHWYLLWKQVGDIIRNYLIRRDPSNYTSVYRYDY